MWRLACLGAAGWYSILYIDPTKHWTLATLPRYLQWCGLLREMSPTVTTLTTPDHTQTIFLIRGRQTSFPFRRKLYQREREGDAAFVIIILSELIVNTGPRGDGSDWIKPIDYKLIKPGIAGIAGVTCVGGGWDISIVLSLKIIIIIIISQSNFLIQSRIY